MRVLNTEYRPENPLDLLSVQGWISLAVLVAVVLAIVLLAKSKGASDKTKEWGKAANDWFTVKGVDYLYFILLAALFFIYLKFPNGFAPLTAAGIICLMVYICMQYGNEGEKAVNKTVLVTAFVLPILPIIAVIFGTERPYLQGLLMLVYVAMVILLLVINPNEFLGKYNQDTDSVYLVAIIGLFAMICVFLNKNVIGEGWLSFTRRVGFMLLCLISIGFAVQYAIRFFMQSPNMSANYILMLLILIGFGILVLYMVARNLPRPGHYSGTNLIKLFLIAWWCQFQDMILASKGAVWLVLLLEIGLILYYIYSRRFYTKLEEGGRGLQLFNEPKKLNLAKSVPVPSNFKYNYAVSCWIWLMPQPPEESPTSSLFANVLDYAGKPRVLYNAALNTLRITMRRPAKEGEDVGANILMADIPKIPLQRWHHLVLSYNNGVFDIFLNGSLYRSVPAVVDTMAGELTTGADKGNRGKICNTVFYRGGGDAAAPFTKQLDAITAAKVVEQYNQFANKSPPIITRIISVGPNPAYLDMRVL